MCKPYDKYFMELTILSLQQCTILDTIILPILKV